MVTSSTWILSSGNRNRKRTLIRPYGWNERKDCACGMLYNHRIEGTKESQ